MEITFFNRGTGQLEEEKVYGKGLIKWLYASFSGKFFINLLCKAPLSKLYGGLQNRAGSSKKIEPFINEFDIKMEEFLPEENAIEETPYSCFNSFFIRRFKQGARSFIQDSNIMPAFCEARYFGFDKIDADHSIPVKGDQLTARQLLASKKWGDVFAGGPLMIARLCPVDYHRYHYPDTGGLLDRYRVKGLYHSVNPLALANRSDIFATNEREVSILDTENFGKIAYIPVGAMCVGKIVETHQRDKFNRGDEKGYFLFGGSTVIILGEKGRWTPTEDILENSKKGIETYIKLGDSVAHKN